MAKEKQIKSKSRVKERGEVFTNEREVKAMVDLVKEPSSDPAATVLEPSCGNGNFLIEVLRRKIETIKKTTISEDRDVYDSHLLQAVCSIYGVDIALDNVEEAREKLLREAVDTNPFGSDIVTDYNIEWVLKKNIICGDMLTLLTEDSKPIVFNQYTFSSTQNNDVLDLVVYQPFVFKTQVVGKKKKEQQTIIVNEPCGEVQYRFFLQLYQEKTLEEFLKKDKE